MMPIYLLILLMIIPVAGMADAVPDAVNANVAIDVQKILGQIADPFEEKIPKPKAPPAPVVAPIIETPKAPPVVEKPVVMTMQQAITNKVIEKPNFIVEGIIWSDTIHEAVVNGQLLSLGDRIGNWVIVDISRDGVTVDVEGQQFIVPVE